MDDRLVAWARAVKARQARAGTGPPVPPLWLFTDPARGDVARLVAALPIGLCGVVFRHDGVPGRVLLLRRVAAICRARRIVLVAAGAAAGRPSGVGQHLRAGQGRTGRANLVTSSAHGRIELVRARRAGAALAFLSPIFPTRSHPGAPSLGPVRWAAQSRKAGIAVLALGGVTGTTVRRLPRWARGVGAIGSLST